MIKILITFGTRPEAIKMAPVVEALKQSGAFDVRVCVTAQHRQMLDQVLELFGIVPDFDLDLMKPGQDLTGYSGVFWGQYIQFLFIRCPKPSCGCNYNMFNYPDNRSHQHPSAQHRTPAVSHCKLVFAGL